MPPRLTYIVDGYNVLHALFPDVTHAELDDRRRWLADQMAGFAAMKDASVVLVYDAHGRPESTSERVAGTRLEICYAGGAFTADTLIARRIAGQPADMTVVVVSADQEVQRTASRAGVLRMTPRELGAEVGSGAEMLAKSEKSVRIPSSLEDKVDVETWRKLERLRKEGR
jgi:predicted RNA-binding protein with PIN domain